MFGCKSTRGRKKTLTDSERKRNKQVAQATYNKAKIYIGNEHERWMHLKNTLGVSNHCGFAKMLLDRMMVSAEEKVESKGEDIRDEYSVHIGDCFKEWKQIRTERQLSTDRDVCRFLLDLYNERINAEHVKKESEGSISLQAATMKKESEGSISLQAATTVIVQDEQEEQDIYVCCGENDFECEKCQHSFMNKDDLEIHIRNCIRTNDFKCEECQQSFETKEYLEIHNCKEANYDCSGCNDSFPTNAELALHQRMYCRKGISPQLLVCDTCGEVNDSQRSLRQHKRIHSSERSPAKMEDLSLCENSDSNSSDNEIECPVKQKNTVKDVKRKKKFKCEICNIWFFNMLYLQLHEKIHTSEVSFMCNQCDEKFSSRNFFIKHMKSHNKKHPFTCNICSKTFTALHRLRKHVLIHSEEKQFQCPTCKGKYTTPRNLQAHIRLIHKEKSFICEVCAEAFRSENSLTIHSRLHTGEKPFPCSKCDKAFTSYFSRHIHDKRYHQDIVKICEDCGKGFGSDSSLALHKLTHTGERPHQCQFCSKAFSQSYNLKVHMRKHTEEKPYKCDICNQRFRYNLQMKQHKTTAHKIQEDA